MLQFNFKNLNKKLTSIKKGIISCIKKSKYKYIFVISNLLCFISISMFNSTFKDSKLEHFSYQISESIKNSRFDKQMIEIKPIEDNDDSLEKIHSYMNENFYNTPGMNFKNCYLGININNSSNNVLVRDGEEINYRKSILLPRTITVNTNKKGIHNMETMDLKMYYKDNRNSNYTCFISDKYALELKEKYQLNDISKVIGIKLFVSFELQNHTIFSSEFAINNFYYSDQNAAPYIESVLGDFIIPSFSHTWKIKNKALFVDSTVSIYKNIAGLKEISEKFDVKDFEWNFPQKTSTKENTYDLNHEFSQYIEYDESMYLLTFIVFGFLFLVSFVLNIYIIHRNNLIFMEEDKLNYKRYSNIFIVGMFILLALVHSIFIAFNLYIYIKSTTNICMLLLLLIYYVMMKIPLMAKKERRVIDND